MITLPENINYSPVTGIISWVLTYKPPCDIFHMDGVKLAMFKAYI